MLEVSFTREMTEIHPSKHVILFNEIKGFLISMVFSTVITVPMYLSDKYSSEEHWSDIVSQLSVALPVLALPLYGSSIYKTQVINQMLFDMNCAAKNQFDNDPTSPKVMRLIRGAGIHWIIVSDFFMAVYFMLLLYETPNVAYYILAIIAILKVIRAYLSLTGF